MTIDSIVFAQGIYAFSIINGLDFSQELIRWGIVPSMEIDSIVYMLEDPWTDENSLN